MSYFSAQKQILVGQGNVDILPYQHVFEPYLESLSKSFTTSLWSLTLMVIWFSHFLY